MQRSQNWVSSMLVLSSHEKHSRPRLIGLRKISIFYLRALTVTMMRMAPPVL